MIFFGSRLFIVGIEERTKKMDRITEEIQHIKNELDERTSNMTDGSIIHKKHSIIYIRTKFNRFCFV
jgi:hypothetical protein